MKAGVCRQDSVGGRRGRPGAWPSSPPSSLRSAAALLCAAALCLLACAGASAQKRPKPALSTGNARRAIAATRGFALNNGAIKVREVGPAGTSPVVVRAEVTEAFRFVRVEDERVAQTGGFFKQKRWRAAEFRTGDRAWEEFGLFEAAAGAGRVEAARAALEELVTEFEARLAAGGGVEEDEAAAALLNADADGGRSGRDAKKKRKEEKKSPEPLTRGPLTIRQLSPMGSSAVAEVVVEAVFGLERDARGRWQVTQVSFGGETIADLEGLWRAVNERKAERARADLAALGSALEAFRRERGFYVVAADSVVLLDHLSPLYIKRLIRLDPWRNPYRYSGTAASYALGSDGPDGKPGTADDVNLSR